MNGNWLISKYYKLNVKDVERLEHRWGIRVQGISKRGDNLLVKWVYLRSLVDIKKWCY